MKHRAIVTLLVAAVPTILLAAEPSAFGAGDLSNPKPYGLTSNEKVILETKDKLNKVTLKNNTQENQLDSLRERIDGLQSIVESISRKTHNNEINFDKLKEENQVSARSSTEYQKRLGESIQENSNNIDKLRTSVSEMSKLIDVINSKYVAKDEFNTLVQDINNFKDLVSKELKSSTKQQTSKKVSSAKLYNDAKAYYDKKFYTKAIENYKELIARKYKPAYSNYMIGEMNFKRKNYAKAITYFKMSSSLYSKASYMPKLMLHTAISMDKTGDKTHANSFYRAIVGKYPSSNEAKEAKKLLGKK